MWTAACQTSRTLAGQASLLHRLVPIVPPQSPLVDQAGGGLSRKLRGAFFSSCLALIALTTRIANTAGRRKRKSGIIPTYLPTCTYLPTYMYLPTYLHGSQNRAAHLSADGRRRHRSADRRARAARRTARRAIGVPRVSRRPGIAACEFGGHGLA